MALGFSARPPTSSIDAAEGASAEARRARLREGGMRCKEFHSRGDESAAPARLRIYT
jgi:hypothetical protein